MPKYMFLARYSADGAKGVVKEGGSARRAATAKAIESAGGKLESFYFALGDVDAYIIADLPDNVTAAAAALISNQTGAVTTRTVVLLTPEDIDAAAKKSIPYRAPGH
jgi:uncharacterized protein with GYD domain